MRKFALLVSILVLAVVAFASDKSSIDELVRTADAAAVDRQPGLYIEIARLQLKTADHAFDAGDNDAAIAAVKDIAVYAEKATDAAVKTNKKLKRIEIDTRKMAERLRDIKRTVNFEDQAPVQAAIDKLEAQRTRLLMAMFKGKQ